MKIDAEDLPRTDTPVNWPVYHAAMERARTMHRRAQKAFSLGRRDMEREMRSYVSMDFDMRIATMLGVERGRDSWNDYRNRIVERVAFLVAAEAVTPKPERGDDEG